MTENLRALLRADLAAERPPPLGDVVAAAIREGRRIRRNRLLAMVGWGLVAAGILAAAVALVRHGGVAAVPHLAIPVAEAPLSGAVPVLSPRTVPASVSPAPTGRRETRTLALHGGTQRAEAMRTKATPAAMLHLLTILVPPGRATHYGLVPGDDLHVQVCLDDRTGPAMGRPAGDPRCGVTMDDGLVALGARLFPQVPVLGR